MKNDTSWMLTALTALTTRTLKKTAIEEMVIGMLCNYLLMQRGCDALAVNNLIRLAELSLSYRSIARTAVARFVKMMWQAEDRMPAGDTQPAAPTEGVIGPLQTALAAIAAGEIFSAHLSDALADVLQSGYLRELSAIERLKRAMLALEDAAALAAIIEDEQQQHGNVNAKHVLAEAFEQALQICQREGAKLDANTLLQYLTTITETPVLGIEVAHEGESGAVLE